MHPRFTLALEPSAQPPMPRAPPPASPPPGDPCEAHEQGQRREDCRGLDVDDALPRQGEGARGRASPMAVAWPLASPRAHSQMASARHLAGMHGPATCYFLRGTSQHMSWCKYLGRGGRLLLALTSQSVRCLFRRAGAGRRVPRPSRQACDGRATEC